MFYHSDGVEHDTERNTSGGNIKCKHRRFDDFMFTRQDDMEA